MLNANGTHALNISTEKSSNWFGAVKCQSGVYVFIFCLMLDVVDFEVMPCKMLHTRKESENEGTQWLGEKNVRIYRRTRKKCSSFFLRSRNTTTLHIYISLQKIPLARNSVFFCCCSHFSLDTCVIWVWLVLLFFFTRKKTTKLCINYCHTYRKSRRELERERERMERCTTCFVFILNSLFFFLLSISAFHPLHSW